MSVRSSASNHYHKKFRIVFLGDSAVGKTSIIQQFTTGNFDQSYNATVGIDFNVKDITINNKKYRLQMWDTAGTQRYRSLIPTYLKNAQIAILVFDLTKPSSLANLEYWHSLLKQYQTAPSIIVGSKEDLDTLRKVSKSDGQVMATKLGINYMEVSAKSGKKVDELFNKAVNMILQDEKDQGQIDKTIKSNTNESLFTKEQSKQKVNLADEKSKKIKNCCLLA